MEFWEMLKTRQIGEIGENCRVVPLVAVDATFGILPHVWIAGCRRERQQGARCFRATGC